MADDLSVWLAILEDWDDIARELCPQDMQSVRIQAGKELHAWIDKLFSECKSFALESTLSGSGILKRLKPPIN